jgi:hypothetical protein
LGDWRRISAASSRLSACVARRKYPDAQSFAALTHAQQIAFLTQVERTPFFERVRLLTRLGMFALPKYGGNRDHVGCKLIGFQDQHIFQPFGYYDRGLSRLQHPGSRTPMTRTHRCEPVDIAIVGSGRRGRRTRARAGTGCSTTTRARTRCSSMS